MLKIDRNVNCCTSKWPSCLQSRHTSCVSDNTEGGSVSTTQAPRKFSKQPIAANEPLSDLNRSVHDSIFEKSVILQ